MQSIIYSKVLRMSAMNNLHLSDVDIVQEAKAGLDFSFFSEGCRFPGPPLSSAVPLSCHHDLFIPHFSRLSIPLGLKRILRLLTQTLRRKMGICPRDLSLTGGVLMITTWTYLQNKLADEGFNRRIEAEQEEYALELAKEVRLE